ncbi:helix-turn-helix transcriptional regulator [Winogradskyella sp.]|uniref:helix-turn-helix domain-containing protein n=1 Tax=Winogradskyella sp. TaxID=1883156 RepID=UPI00261350DA|nr:helix-turn-helix transcriptional regulator [Winogradskyella sp.]
MLEEQKIHKQIFLKELGKRIKKLREDSGLSQFELANEAGIVKNQIGRIERGEINTSIYTLKKISSVLKVHISELLSFEH